jgi:uncharacterized protein YdaL
MSWNRALAVAPLIMALVGTLAGEAHAAQAGRLDANGDGHLDVLVLYDGQGELGGFGHTYALHLINLLGHFPEIRVRSEAAADYQAGGLLNEEVTFYVGTVWDAPIAVELFEDFYATDRPLVWIGANLWQLTGADPDAFGARFGFSYKETDEGEGSGRQTTFYRDVAYKGRVLDKFSWWNGGECTHLADPVIAVVDVTDAEQVEVLANIRHSGSGEAIPWALRSRNLAVVTDNPFTFIHETSPYLAFSDLLHDLVGIDHAPTRQALFRLEDVHPAVEARSLRMVTDELDRGRKRPWNIAVVPAYRDPLGVYNEGLPYEVSVGSKRVKAWRLEMERAMDRGAELVLHGCTHQYGTTPNPVNGVSGADFEFWDAINDSFVPEDSFEYVEQRLTAGIDLLASVGWTAWAFEPPHYRASTLDYLAFPEFFDTTYQRAVYEPYAIEQTGRTLGFEDVQRVSDAIRWDEAQVTSLAASFGSQFFPYLIERDIYGQRVVPENLGNLTPAVWASGERDVRTVSDILEAAEANLVNRCAFASFFYHPQLIIRPDVPGAGGPQPLRRLIDGIEALGYTFVQASELEAPLPLPVVE